VDTLQPRLAVPSYASNSEGEALVFWEHRFGAPPATLVLEVRLQEGSAWTRLAELHLHPVLRSTLTISDDLVLDISSDPTWGKDDPVSTADPSKRERGRRRFTIALSATRAQLRSLLPYFRGRGCIRLRKVFLEDGAALDLDTEPNVTVLGLTSLTLEALKGIDALIDFTDHKTIAELRTRRLSSNVTALPVVFCAGKRFFNSSGKLSRVFLDWLDSLGEAEVW